MNLNFNDFMSQTTKQPEPVPSPYTFTKKPVAFEKLVKIYNYVQAHPGTEALQIAEYCDYNLNFVQNRLHNLYLRRLLKKTQDSKWERSHFYAINGVQPLVNNWEGGIRSAIKPSNPYFSPELCKLYNEISDRNACLLLMEIWGKQKLTSVEWKIFRRAGLVGHNKLTDKGREILEKKTLTPNTCILIEARP